MIVLQGSQPCEMSHITLISGHVAGVWDCATLKSSQVIASASEDCTLRLVWLQNRFSHSTVYIRLLS